MGKRGFPNTEMVRFGALGGATRNCEPLVRRLRDTREYDDGILFTPLKNLLPSDKAENARALPCLHLVTKLP